MFDKMTIDDVDVRGKKVLMRVDFNVPLTEDQEVADDARIVASLPTIRKILNDGGRLVLMSHLGRPKGKPMPNFSLRPAAGRLSELLNKPVKLAPDCIGPEVVVMVESLHDGDVVLLENVRFYQEETDNDAEFSQALARLADVYVNDAFGSAHRAHASVEGVAHHVTPAVAGYLMKKELEYLGKALNTPKRPFVAMLGGAKISGKIDVIENMLPKVDAFLLGGAMTFTFDACEGLKVGTSLVEQERMDMAKDLLAKFGNVDAKVMLPLDYVVADSFSADAKTAVVNRGEIPDGWMGLDIGPRTIEAYSKMLEEAGTVAWNGPMGVFEMKPFALGTRAVAEALAKATSKGAVTVVGGGDSAAALADFGLTGAVSHVSTGGGASLEFMAGKVLPGVAALSDR